MLLLGLVLVFTGLVTLLLVLLQKQKPASCSEQAPNMPGQSVLCAECRRELSSDKLSHELKGSALLCPKKCLQFLTMRPAQLDVCTMNSVKSDTA